MNGPGLSAARIGLKTVLKTLLAVPGLLLPRAPGLRVLCYHRVNDHPFETLGPVSRELSVQPSAFAWQLAYLKRRGHRGITLAEFEAMLDGRTRLDPKAVLITFDDGYADNLEVAAPLLAAYDFTAVVFAVSEFLGRETAAVWPDADPPGFGRFLTREQLAALPSSGLEVGSHTLTHPLLTQVSSDLLHRELALSRRHLAALLERPVIAFCYPEGDLDAAVEAEVARCGYALGFTSVPGLNHRGTSRTSLRRTEVSASDSRFVFRMKLAGALDWLAFKEAAGFRAAIRRLNRLMIPYARSEA